MNAQLQHNYIGVETNRVLGNSVMNSFNLKAKLNHSVEVFVQLSNIQGKIYKNELCL
jgi:hypothetical protein